MKYLITGIISCLFFACGTKVVDHSVTGQFHLINKMKSEIRLDFFSKREILENHNIAVNDTLKLIVDTEGPKKLSSSDISYPIKCDSVIVLINNEKQFKYIYDDVSDESNFLLNKNYNVDIISSNDFIYSYIFEN